MTTSRIVRGTKVRIFLYICGVLIITGVIACYNNTLSQLDEARKSSEICHQQEENLSVQLQMISDYKQRLEKSLKTEKAEHTQTKTELGRKLDEERTRNDKLSSDTSLRYNSLQQHYNLLQTQHDDFKEECSKTQNKQMSEVNDLQAKLKEVQEELKKVERSKENLKSQYLQSQVDKDNLQIQLKSNSGNKAESQSEINHLTKVNHELKEELHKLREKCPAFESLQAPNFNQESSSSPRSVSIKPQKDINAVGPNPKEEKGVLSVPNSSQQTLRKSTTASNNIKASEGKLNGARPLLIPTVTPKSSSSKAEGLLDIPLPLPYVKKFPEGVVHPPEDKPAETDNNKHGQGEMVDNRYRIKIDDGDAKKLDENVAHEVFDHNNGAYDALAFGDLNNEAIKNDKPDSKLHIDNLRVGGLAGDLPGGNNKNYNDVDYKEIQNDLQDENDPEEDDEEDDFADHFARQKDPAVRN